MALEKYFPNIGALCFRNPAPLFGKILKPFHLIKNPFYPVTGSIRIVLGDIFSVLPYFFLGPGGSCNSHRLNRARRSAFTLE
jgi:hypothetical protein